LKKRDLHPGNVLLPEFTSCYIGDLGLSVLESEAGDIEDIKGVMPYLAPELLSGRGSYSQATDVYAFGIIMWEISSHEKPFHDKVLALRIVKGFRPEVTKDTPSFYQDLMQRCWHSDPTQRPTANEIYDLTYKWCSLSSCPQEIKDQINKAEEIRLRNVGIKKEMKIQHPGAIYTSRSLTNISKGKQFLDECYQK
jgi:serine/threonine protein kinase